MDRLKKPILIACLAVGALSCLCASPVALFAWYVHSLEIRYTNPSDYPKAREAIVAHHGAKAAHLPVTIPGGARNVHLDTFISGWFPAPDGPFLNLSFSLPPDEVAAELARLRALGPVSEEMSGEWPFWLSTGTTEAEPDRSGCIAFEFDPDGGGSAWVDPLNGEVGYDVSRY